MIRRTIVLALCAAAFVAQSSAALAARAGGEEALDLFKRETPASTEAHAKAETPPPDPVAQLAGIHKKLVALERPGAAADGSPPGTSEVEIADRIRLLHQIERSLSQLVDGKARNAGLVAARTAAESRADAWRGFDNPPPYPLPFVDGLEASRDTIAQRVSTIKAREKLLRGLATRLQLRLRDSEAGVRQAQERRDHASGDTDGARARWLLELAQLRAEEATTSLDQTQQVLANAGEEKKAAEAELRLANAKLRTAQGHVRFTQQDLAEVDAGLDTHSQALSADIDRALAAWRNAREVAASAPPAEAELRRQQVENASIELEVARMRNAANEYERKAWATRYAVMHSPTRTHAADAYENLVGSLASLQAWSEYQNEQLAATEGEVATLDAQIRSATPAQAAPLRALRDVYAEREVVQKSAADATRPLQALLARWQAGAASSAAPLTWAERVGEAWATTRLVVARVWNFELFSVEDSFETVEGRRITAQRSITVGKTIGALLLILVGYWLCLKLARVARWIAMRMLGRSHAQASIVHRWTLAFLVALLVMASLLAVRIPLTVFAFLGGALAIGIGFGAQNLLKNLMSGIMLLIEKPLRVGDYIEFEKVRGRVTNIGFRASVVRAEDGVETLIPNSTFIESNVTNLTYSSPAMRLQLDVGVEYGVDPARVRKALLDAALSHRQVLKHPEPLAIFDDFAADAQKFRLAYWIDATPPAHMSEDLETGVIASEIRELIVARLAEAGIGIPFPQRTLHVDAPLRVEIAPKAAEA
ncbi:MAG TPA: mechanosensitive ion channel domain-containing protein [Casimicrobiaceae bacterium]